MAQPAKSRRWLQLTFQQQVDIAAPTLPPLDHQDHHDASCSEDSASVTGADVAFARGSNEMPKTFLDKSLDRVVRQSGSIWMFILIQVVLLGWSFLGIPFSTSDTWQIVMGNGQAIFSYVWDSLLMRHQLLGFEESRRWTSCLRSRGASKIRMLRKLAKIQTRRSPGHPASVPGADMSTAPSVTDGIPPSVTYEIQPSTESPVPVLTTVQAELPFELDLPKETWFGKAVSWFSYMIGHIFCVVLYWATFWIWIGFGPSTGWSDTWQLDWNSALSAWMVFTFSLLAIAREQNSEYRKRCIKAVYSLDCILEQRLRQLTGDKEDNASILTEMPKVNIVQTWINYYANLVGTLVGIALLIICLIVWICIGPVMNFSTDWWLIIGTYAGLIGLHDGFVLRNMQMRLDEWEQPWYNAIEEDDAKIVKMLRDEVCLEKESDMAAEKQQDLAKPCESLKERTWRWTRWVSERMLFIFAHESAVVADIFFIIGLICGASALHWNMTGQLLCNIPPMTLESFMMQILITGHSSLDMEMRERVKAMYDHRVFLYSRLTVHRSDLPSDEKLPLEKLDHLEQSCTERLHR